MNVRPVTHTRIHVVYPKPEQEIYDDSTFVMGSVQGAHASLDASLRLVINQQVVPVSAHGFFAWKIPLHAGLNPVKMQVYENGATHPEAEELFALHRMPAYESPPTTPLTVIIETIQPHQDVWLMAQDSLKVGCLASVNADVSVTVPGLLDTPVALIPVEKSHAVAVVGSYIDTREMIFAEKHWMQKRMPVHGYYQATIPLLEAVTKASGHILENMPIVIHIKHGSQEFKKNASGRLTILKHSRPALIQKNDTVTRTSPPDGARLTPQKSGTLVDIDGLEKGWLRARLSRDECFYIPQESVRFLSETHAVSLGCLEAVQIHSKNEHVSELTLSIAGQQMGAPPIQIEALPESRPQRLQIRLYNVYSKCDFIRYPTENPRINQVHWRAVGEKTLELWVDLDRPLAGYDYELRDGQWMITIKTLPKRLEEIRVLIDPGHGGSESGATGLNGILEKDLNLKVSHLLESALKAEGFQVFMTRMQDVEVSLPERQEKTVQTQADIGLSIHHNALPDGRDPLAAIGTCTFYYHPFSKPLAEAVLKGMTTNENSAFTIPNYGLFYDSLFIPRIHQAISLLIEIGFFTNPTEFERLINPEFQKEAVYRIAQALKDYCLRVSKY